MRRLAILFAFLAILSMIEQMVLSGGISRAIQASGSIRRPFMSLAEWRSFLIGPLRRLQQATARSRFLWLQQSN